MGVVDVVVGLVVAQCRAFNGVTSEVVAGALDGSFVVEGDVSVGKVWLLVAQREQIVRERDLEYAVPVRSVLQNGNVGVRVNENGSVNCIGDVEGINVRVGTLTGVEDGAVVGPCVGCVKVVTGSDTDGGLASQRECHGIEHVKDVVLRHDRGGPWRLVVFVWLLNFAALREHLSRFVPWSIQRTIAGFVVGNSWPFICASKDVIMAIGVDGGRVVNEEVIGTRTRK